MKWMRVEAVGREMHYKNTCNVLSLKSCCSALQKIVNLEKVTLKKAKVDTCVILTVCDCVKEVVRERKECV